MNNFFDEKDIKSLDFFSKYLTSMGVKGYAEMEMHYGDYFGTFEYKKGEIPSHLSNNYRVEVPPFIFPVINKVMEEAYKVYYELDINEELSYERIDLTINTKEKEIIVELYGSYYGSESGGGISWDLDEEEPGSILHKIFETLSEIGPEKKEFRLSYNGSGDSGYIEDSFYSGESVPADIEDWCYRQLENNYGGWEINEGSDGYFLFNMEEKTVSLDHTYNTEESISENLFRENY